MKKRLFAGLLALCMTINLMSATAFAEEPAGAPEETTYVAQIGKTPYETFDDALGAAKAMTGDVIVEIYDRVTLKDSLKGSYDSIKFVGKDKDAEIYLDVTGYIEAPEKKVAFDTLTLSKSNTGGHSANAGFMNVAFGVFAANETSYTDCVFKNGAYASWGNVKFTDCTFYRSHGDYGLWAYGDVDVTVDGCTFADFRGIKMYDEAHAGTVNLTVKNTDFSALAGERSKPAIVLTYGESVTLEKNTYSSTGVFELDLDGVPNGTPVISDVPPTCVNDKGACGVLVGGKIYTTFEQAYAAAVEGDTITLLADVKFSNIVVIDKAITLDGNGHKLTSSAERAINVKGASGITIKNLTIDASGERAINVIQNATNVTIENVTATAANYTVNVASSAPNAVVTIDKSTLTGLCTVNVASAGANVTVADSTINCNDNNITPGESYAALALNKEAIGGKITATNCTINVAEGSDSVKARNGAEGGTVTVDGSVKDVIITVAVITYEGSPYYHGFATLGEAVEFAKAGDTVKLIRDDSTNVTISAPVVIDLAGKSYTGTVELKEGATLTLKEGATLTAPTGLKVITKVADSKVEYKDGKYSIVACTHTNKVTDKAVAAGCSSTGLTEGSHCGDCGKVLVKQTTVAAKGHSYSKKYDSSSHWSQCSVCGKVKDDASHSYSNGKCSCGHTVKVEVYVPETPAPAPAPTPAPETTTTTQTTTQTTTTTKPVEEAAKPVETPVEEVVVDTKIVEEVASEEVKEAVKETVTVAETKEVEKETGTVTEVKVAVTTETVDKVIENTEVGATVILPLTEVAEEGQAVTEAAVAVEALEKIVEAEAALTVEFEGVKVTFESETIKAIAEQAKGSTIELRVVPVEHHELNEEQKAVLEAHDVAVRVSAQIFSDGEYIGDFKGGKATIAIPFTPEEGKAAEDHKVYFVDDNGEMTLMPAVYVDGHMVFETNHFSDYVIVYDEVASAEEGPSPVDDDMAVEEPVEEAEKEGGLPIVPIAIIVVAVILVVAFVATRKRNDEE